MTAVWFRIVTDLVSFRRHIPTARATEDACHAHCSRRNFVLRVAETDGLRVKQATLCGCFYQSVPDNITICRYLCVPPKHFVQVHSRGRFWYGWRLLIRNVWVNRVKLYNTWHWRNYVSFQCPAVTVCTTRFNIQQFSVLPTQCIYVFCVVLRTNSYYFPIQH